MKTTTNVCVAICASLILFVGASTALAQAPPTATHLYVMDEGSGTTTADLGSPGGVNGQLQSGTSWSTDTPFSYSGNRSVVMADSASDGTIDITGAFPTDADAVDQWSASMWAKRDSSDSGWAGLLGSWSSGSGIAGDFQIRQHPTIPVQIIGRNPSGQLYSSNAGGASWPADEWSHIAINVDHTSGQTEWWIDGAYSTTAITVGGTGGWSNTGGTIGSGNVYAMQGPMDEVAIWSDRLLSEGEAAYLLGNTLVPEPSSFFLLAAGALGLLVGRGRRNR